MDVAISTWGNLSGANFSNSANAEFALPSMSSDFVRRSHPALTYLPIEYVAEGPGPFETQFADCEQCASRMQKRTKHAVWSATRERSRRSI